jgi:catechol 2,3-dioxygenase-like lactoylglutathione lyase family enzyme
MDPITVERIDHVTVNVTDVAKAKSFYTGLLRMTETPRPKSFDFPGAWYQVGPTLLHLVVRAQRDGDSSRHFAIWVRDVHAAARRVEQEGFPVKWDTGYKIPGVDRFFTQDPDGNRIEIQGQEAGG